MMGESLAGRSVVITGASRGIGLAAAQLLAGAGAWVGMVARSEVELAAAADKVGGHPLAADVSSPASVLDLERRVAEAIGGAPDAVVNSAGAFALAPFVDTEPETFQRMLAANLLGPFLVVREFLPAMLKRGTGHVVNVGSVAGRVPLPGNAAYSASKYGLRGMHEVLAVELQGTGVRATLIDPGATDTPLWDPLDPDRAPHLPSRSEMMRPMDVARAVLYVLQQPQEVEVTTLALRSV